MKLVNMAIYLIVFFIDAGHRMVIKACFAQGVLRRFTLLIHIILPL